MKRIKKPSILTLSVTAITVALVSCIDPVTPPPPHFRPNPPYPPQQVDPYGNDNSENSSSGEVNPPAAPSRPGEFPTARPTDKADEVVSPYEPYNIINVEGYKSGELVRDPHNKQIFRVP